jgi:hypothetical protein
VTERLRFLLVLAVLAVLGFAGMTTLRSRNADEPASTGTKADVAERVFNTDAPIKSGKFNFEVKLRIDGRSELAAPAVLAGSGAFQSHKGRQAEFDIKAGVNAWEFKGDLGLRVANGLVYLMQDGAFYKLGKATRSDGGKDDDSSVAADDVFTNMRHEGVETLDGVKTDHVSAQLDVSKILALIEKAEGNDIPQVAKLMIGAAVREAKVEAWAGQDDHKLRKLSLHVVAQTPGRLARQAQGVTGGDLRAEVSLTDVDKPQRIASPRNARGLDKLNTDGLGVGMLSGLAALDGGDDKAKEAKPAAKADPNEYDLVTRSYLACVADAGKPEELQKCIAALR